MKPTKKQLADPTWWDRNSPEGTTHVVPYTTIECISCWVKKDGEKYFYNYSGIGSCDGEMV